MGTAEMFNILDSTASTNNYAMAKVHAGLAKHGQAWFAHDQTEGRGQQGKIWESKAGQNIALSIVLQPAKLFFQRQFFFSAVVANACYDFYKAYAGEEIAIKWPNDIYWRDRKAGGILIENKLMGENWKWAVVGIGLNINQTVFGDGLINAVSLKQITGRSYDPISLAKTLHEQVFEKLNTVIEADLPGILMHYNERLFLKDKMARLKQGNIVFETCIKGVNEFGQMMTEDAVERRFNFGEVSLLIDN